jgi:alpha-tubulin suppressor-like RCC1 family protein
VTAAHAAWCWGQDGYGQVGDGGPTGERAQPVAVAGGLSFAVVMAGGTHTCGLTTTGAAYCWGNNGNGQLGAGNIPPTHAPVAVLAP